MDEEELNVVLRRHDDSTAGLGFSLLDKPGFPPVIYDIEENSPAAESGKVEAGDVILKINDVDVRKYSIKEVLKCLRLAGNSVALKLKRDQSLKEKILYYLSATCAENVENELLNTATTQQTTATALTNGNGVSCHRQSNNVRARRKECGSLQYTSLSSPLQDVTSSRKYENESAVTSSSSSIVARVPSSSNALAVQQSTMAGGAAAGTPQQQPLCEAYMMTGERVLKLTKNTSLGPKFQKKIDSLRSHHNVRRNLTAAAATATATTNDQGRGRHNKSTPSSPVEIDYNDDLMKSSSANSSPTMDANPLLPNDRGAGRTPYVANVSKSDDDIQYKKEVSVSSTSVQVDDEDITSSLNTLLNTTMAHSKGKTDDKRSFWTCTTAVTSGTTSSRQQRDGTGDGVSIASSENESSHPSCSPPSPTSVSSSVMSSVSSSITATDRKRTQATSASSNNNSVDSSQIEAVSNISSPDYQEETSDLLNSHDIGMEVTDPSDSDSTLLASEPKIRRLNKCVGSDNMEQNGLSEKSNHRIVIQVKGMEKENKAYNPNDMNSCRNCNVTKLSQYSSLLEEDENGENNDDPKNAGYEALSEYDDELIALTEGAANLAKSISPPHSGSSEEESGSDGESLRHYSPKGVDVPSAMRLAHRLYTLDKFKKSDVCRHLSKNNEFSRVVAEEYLKHFEFENDSLDEALRKFLKQFSLTGETQERERVLVHFSKRYLDCNPGSFNSQDAVHTLTCAIMLLNTDLHGQNIGRKMSSNAFIENLSGLNDGENFPRDVLKALYQAIKNSPLEWAVDDEIEENVIVNNLPTHNRTENFDQQDDYLIHVENMINANGEPYVIDFKKGYVMRKCCYEPNGKKTSFGKRGWKMLHCTLRDLVLYLHKDEQDVNKMQIDNTHNVIRLHHALATLATDYTKKQRVFRLQTADRAEYLFQTSDDIELQSWVDTINLVCASFSAPALPEPVGSLKKFQRPLFPSAPSRLNLRDQLKEHEQTVERLEKELEIHRKQTPDKSAKNLVVQNYNEKESYLCYEIKRYKTYAYLLQSKLPPMVPVMVQSMPLVDIESDDEGILCGSTATTTVVEETEEASSPVSMNRTRSKTRYS